MRCPLPWRPIREELLVLGPVSGDGLRLTHLSRELAGHRDLFGRLSIAIWSSCGTLFLGTEGRLFEGQLFFRRVRKLLPPGNVRYVKVANRRAMVHDCWKLIVSFLRIPDRNHFSG